MKGDKFALYGFEVSMPTDSRVEINPKTSREKGDVVFHSQKGNRFFISWGKLDDATSKFKSLQDFRDISVKRIRSGPDVTKVNVADSREGFLEGHETLFSHFTAQVKAGVFSRSSYERNMWSAHFYCPERSRYYVIYSIERYPEEYSEFGKVFESMVQSFHCHGPQSTFQ